MDRRRTAPKYPSTLASMTSHLISYFLNRIVILPPCAPPPYASLLTSLPLGLVALLMRSFSVAYVLEVALVEVGLEVGQDWRSMAIHHQSSMETFPIVIDIEPNVHGRGTCGLEPFLGAPGKASPNCSWLGFVRDVFFGKIS